MVTYLIGVDVGSTSLRLGVYQADGELVSEARREYEIDHPRHGYAECNAEDWWTALGETARQALKGVDPSRVSGMAITHQRQTFVCVDREMHPLRPAVMWYDTRCGEQARWATENLGADYVYRRTGSPPGRRGIYKVMWIKEHEPEIYSRIHKVLFIQDYLVHRLTGELVTAPGICAASGCLDIADRYRWAEDIITKCGLDPAIWVKDILPGGSVAGMVTDTAASATGLPVGMPVCLAAGDQSCGNLGVGGAFPGRLGINGGTSCALEMVTERFPCDEQKRFFVDISPTGAYIVENGITSGGSALMNWYRANFGLEEEEKARRENRDVWEIIYDDLASQAPVGAGGLMLLPYLRGANGPYWDPKARGMLFGLRTDHGKEHLVRAIIEGLAFESRQIAEGMEAATGIRAEEIRMYGGSAKSGTWNQIFADVTGLPVITTTHGEAPMLGAAICAGKGIGVFAGIREAADAMIRVKRVYEPYRERCLCYEQLYQDVYRKLYQTNKDLLDRLAELVASR